MAGDTTDTTSTGTTGSTGLSGIGTDYLGQRLGTESSLSQWAGPYVTEMLGRGMGAASSPYQAYTGPLTAGTSSLQNQAFQGLAGLTLPTGITGAMNTAGQISNQAMGASYSPTTYTNTYTAPAAYSPTDITTGKFTDLGVSQQYMNPYVQTALNPQIEEARRQAAIANLQNRTAATRAGAYGGSRQALMESEGQRNLLQNLANITGAGYNTAYQQAQQAYTSDQARALQAAQANEASKEFGYGQGMTAAQLAAQYGLEGQKAAEASKQFGANYGLQGLSTALQAANTQGQLGSTINQQNLANLAAQTAAGATQRDIEQQGITADYGQFQEQRDYPYKQVQYLQSLLQNLPLSTQSYTYQQPSATNQALSSASGIMQLYNKLFGAG